LANEGKYLEADKIKSAINELKNTSSGKFKKDVSSQHELEMKNLDDSYNYEISTFNKKWEEIFNDFNYKFKKMEENLSNKHKLELEELLLNLDVKLPKQVKFSREYLELRTSEYNLVKQEM